MKLKELKEIYKVVRKTVNGLNDASLKFNIPEDSILLHIQSKDRLYPYSKFTISQALPLWYLHEIGYTLKEIAHMNSSNLRTIGRIIDTMSNQDDKEIEPNIGVDKVSLIITYRSQKMTYKQISEMCGISIYNIKKALQPYREDLPKRVVKKGRHITNKEIVKMKKLRNKGYSYSDIAKNVGRSITTVFNYINDLV